MNKDYEKWRYALRAEIGKFTAVEGYLSASGLMRLHSLRTISDYANFCETATELVEWFRLQTGMSDGEIKPLLTRTRIIL